MRFKVLLSLCVKNWLCIDKIPDVRACERERERRSHHSGVYSTSEIILIAACWQTHTSIITVSVKQLCSPLWLELMLKLRTLLTVFTFILKAEAPDYGKGRYISNAACGVRPITMHCKHHITPLKWQQTNSTKHLLLLKFFKHLVQFPHCNYYWTFLQILFFVW